MSPEQRVRPLLTARFVAGALALASAVPLWFGAWLGVLGIAVAAQQPDASVPDGDPCCGHPDTWGEVALGLALGAGTLVGVAALLYVAAALARFAWTGTAPSRRRLGAAATYVAAWVAVIVVMAAWQ